MTDKLYADRKPWELEPYYCNHVAAMTAEGLHEKSAIAAELAWRDKEINRLCEKVEDLEATLSASDESSGYWRSRTLALEEERRNFLLKHGIDLGERPNLDEKNT